MVLTDEFASKEESRPWGPMIKRGFGQASDLNYSIFN
jgi:hypothetical protein